MSILLFKRAWSRGYAGRAGVGLVVVLYTTIALYAQDDVGVSRPPGIVVLSPRLIGKTPTEQTAPAAVDTTNATETLTLRIEKTSTARPAAGQPFGYQIKVRNTGLTPLRQVRIEERFPNDVRCLGTDPAAENEGNRRVWIIGVLEPNGELRFQVTLLPDRDGAVSAVTTATVSAQATGTWRTGQSPGSLSLTMTAPERVAVGGQVVFRLTARNNGSTPMAGVLIRDRLPRGLHHLAGEYVEADVGLLGPGQSKQLTLAVTAIQAGQLTNQAVVTAKDGSEATARATLVVSEQPGPTNAAPTGGSAEVIRAVAVTAPRVATAGAESTTALLLKVVDLDSPIPVGGETTYEIRVLNHGTTAATGVRLWATLPTGMTLVGATGPTTGRAQGQQVVYPPLPSLAGGGETWYRIRVRGQQTGDWRFRVQVNSDQLRQPTIEERLTRVYAP